MLRLTREFYEPRKKPGMITIRPKDVDAVIYVWNEKPNRHLAMGFSGKRAKPDFHYVFRKPDGREKYVRDYIARLMETAKRKAEWKAAQKAPTKLKEGDILYTSWGYDQTNVDFFQVVKVVGKRTVEVRKIISQVTESRRDAEYVVPVRDAFIGEPTRHVVSDDTVRISDCQRARPWHGNPCYTSSGH